jgi:hypothetical protein
MKLISGKFSSSTQIRFERLAGLRKLRAIRPDRSEDLVRIVLRGQEASQMPGPSQVKHSPTPHAINLYARSLEDLLRRMPEAGRKVETVFPILRKVLQLSGGVSKLNI